MVKELKVIIDLLKDIKCLIDGSELSDLEKEYIEYKYFADTRGQKLLADRGLLDEYNSFMNECEIVLFGDERELVLPKPSPELEAFKNKFHKYF